MRPATVAVLAMLALVLGGCFSGEPEVPPEERVAEEQREEDEAAGEDGGGGAGQSVEFLADDIFYEDLPGSVAAGATEFVMENVGDIEHNLHIEELGDAMVIEDVPAGETGSGTTELDAGSYTLYCSIPGHREAGMEETLEVEG